MPKGKGSAFERLICDQLSAWWTGDPGKSVFWRTANSGGRATVRGRKGKATAGSAGDIGATEADGEGLLKRVCFELKRGYSKFTPYDLIDRPDHYNKQVWEDWINQARRSQQHAGAMYWMVIHRRDKRPTMCVFPYRMWRVMAGETETPCHTFLLRLLVDATRQPYKLRVVAMRWDEFLDTFTRKDVERL